MNGNQHPPSHLVIGKMTGDNSIAFSSLVFPHRFDWLKDLKPEGLMQFFSELLAAVEKSERTRNVDELAEMLEDWEESTETPIETVPAPAGTITARYDDE